MLRYLLLLFLLPVFTGAQPILLPSIGIGPMPSDNDSICDIPWYLGGFTASGLQKGDTAFDFTLYNLNGDTLNLQHALSQGRPVLLVAASYTCPVFRNKVPILNTIFNTYAGQVDVYIIYVVEAHPDIDTSVYFGHVSTTSANINAGILYRQPVTYGERKAVITDMIADISILPPVFIDGTCNNWWLTYGPAPNNAYLIDTNGIVFSKHGWFDRYPDNILCDIDSLLGLSPGNCSTSTGNSSFTFQQISSDTVYDEAGVTISVDAELTNTGTNDILVYARRQTNNLPLGWASSMCIDVCYSTSVDSVMFILPAGAVQPVHVYFYTTTGIVDTGFVRLRFRNESNISNQATFNAYAISTLTTDLEAVNRKTFEVFPNPATSVLNINTSGEQEFEIQICNLPGQLIMSAKNENRIDLSSLKDGMYLIKIRQNKMTFVEKLMKM